MNDEKTVIFYLVVVILSLSLLLSATGNVLQYSHLSKLRNDISELESELRQYRERVELLEDEKSEIDGTIAEARGIVEETNRSLCSIGGSVSEIRDGISKLHEYVKKLENCLSDTGSNGNSDNYTSGDTGNK